MTATLVFSLFGGTVQSIRRGLAVCASQPRALARRPCPAGRRLASCSARTARPLGSRSAHSGATPSLSRLLSWSPTCIAFVTVAPCAAVPAHGPRGSFFLPGPVRRLRRLTRVTAVAHGRSAAGRRALHVMLEIGRASCRERVLERV